MKQVLCYACIELVIIVGLIAIVLTLSASAMTAPPLSINAFSATFRDRRTVLLRRIYFVLVRSEFQ